MSIMPHKKYQDVKVGDLISLTKDNYGAIRYFGKIQVVTWVPENWAGKTRMIYPNKNDWIQVYSSKQRKMWHVRLGEFEVLKKDQKTS